MCGWSGGGHAWLVQGGMHGWSRGACVVGLGGPAWFYSGGMRGFIPGVCVVLFGGMRGFIWGACVVLFGGACMVFFSFFGYNEIRSMSGRYASCWNAFLLDLFLLPVR